MPCTASPGRAADRGRRAIALPKSPMWARTPCETGSSAAHRSPFFATCLLTPSSVPSHPPTRLILPRDLQPAIVVRTRSVAPSRSHLDCCRTGRKGYTPLQLQLAGRFGSIHGLDACKLPDSAVLIGRNGVGKTQLLAGIANCQISGAWRKWPKPETYDIAGFRSRSSGRAVYGASLFAEATAQRLLRGTGGQSPAARAQDGFDRTIESYGLALGTHGGREFERTVRSSFQRTEIARRPPVGDARVARLAFDLLQWGTIDLASSYQR